MALARDVSSSTVPRAFEPEAHLSPAEVAIYQQLRQIGSQLRTVGMQSEAIQGWTDRLQSILAIVEQGCCMNGVPGAGELLLDMLSDLIHDITHTAPILPQATDNT